MTGPLINLTHPKANLFLKMLALLITFDLASGRTVFDPG